jgi:hypothetical protein
MLNQYCQNVDKNKLLNFCLSIHTGFHIITSILKLKWIKK